MPRPDPNARACEQPACHGRDMEVLRSFYDSDHWVVIVYQCPKCKKVVIE